MTAVIRFALAILQAWIMMQSSMREVLTAPLPVLMMYTSSSRTDSVMVTFDSPMPLFVISALERGTPMLQNSSVSQRIWPKGTVPKTIGYRRAMISASSGWLVPTRHGGIR